MQLHRNNCLSTQNHLRLQHNNGKNVNLYFPLSGKKAAGNIA